MNFFISVHTLLILLILFNQNESTSIYGNWITGNTTQDFQNLSQFRYDFYFEDYSMDLFGNGTIDFFYHKPTDSLSVGIKWNGNVTEATAYVDIFIEPFNSSQILLPSFVSRVYISNNIINNGVFAIARSLNISDFSLGERLTSLDVMSLVQVGNRLDQLELVIPRFSTLPGITFEYDIAQFYFAIRTENYLNGRNIFLSPVPSIVDNETSLSCVNIGCLASKLLVETLLNLLELSPGEFALYCNSLCLLNDTILPTKIFNVTFSPDYIHYASSDTCVRTSILDLFQLVPLTICKTSQPRSSFFNITTFDRLKATAVAIGCPESDSCGVCNGNNEHADYCGVCFGRNQNISDCGVCFEENNLTCPGKVKTTHYLSLLSLGFDPQINPISTMTFIGDVNGDGFTDLAIGVPSIGSIYILFIDNLANILDFVVINNTSIRNSSFDATSMGTTIVPLGDLNSDSVPDIAVGAPEAFGSGRIYFLFLNRNGTILQIKSISNTTTGVPSPDPIIKLNPVPQSNPMPQSQPQSDIPSNTPDLDLLTIDIVSYLFGETIVYFQQLDGKNPVIVTPMRVLNENNSFQKIRMDNETLVLPELNFFLDVTVLKKGGEVAGKRPKPLPLSYIEQNELMLGLYPIHINTISAIGDLNNDGRPELAISILSYDQGTNEAHSALYILFLFPDGTISNFSRIEHPEPDHREYISSEEIIYILTNTNSFLRRVPCDFACSITSLGDLNNDNVLDIAVSAPNESPTLTSSGAFYVFLMNPNGTVFQTFRVSANDGNLWKSLSNDGNLYNLGTRISAIDTPNPIAVLSYDKIAIVSLNGGYDSNPASLIVPPNQPPTPTGGSFIDSVIPPQNNSGNTSEQPTEIESQINPITIIFQNKTPNHSLVPKSNPNIKANFTFVSLSELDPSKNLVVKTIHLINSPWEVTYTSNPYKREALFVTNFFSNRTEIKLGITEYFQDSVVSVANTEHSFFVGAFNSKWILTVDNWPFESRLNNLVLAVNFTTEESIKQTFKINNINEKATEYVFSTENSEIRAKIANFAVLDGKFLSLQEVLSIKQNHSLFLFVFPSFEERLEYDPVFTIVDKDLDESVISSISSLIIIIVCTVTGILAVLILVVISIFLTKRFRNRKKKEEKWKEVQF